MIKECVLNISNSRVFGKKFVEIFIINGGLVETLRESHGS
jgi:hypothetical protein